MESLDQFEGDLYLYSTEDGAELNIEDGLFVCDRGFRTAVYLSLFGGNEYDDGKTDVKKTWWGNLIAETKQEEKYVSRFQNIIISLPLSVKNIQIAEKAASLDLDWIKKEKNADKIEIESLVKEKDLFSLIVRLKKDGLLLYENEYKVNWEAVVNGV